MEIIDKAWSMNTVAPQYILAGYSFPFVCGRNPLIQHSNWSVEIQSSGEKSRSLIKPICSGFAVVCVLYSNVQPPFLLKHDWHRGAVHVATPGYLGVIMRHKFTPVLVINLCVF